jgi:hypothetical protein
MFICTQSIGLILKAKKKKNTYWVVWVFFIYVKSNVILITKIDNFLGQFSFSFSSFATKTIK